MQEKPKKKNESDKENSDDPDSWEKDQKQHGYYYDDAHGYEVFHPENEDDDESPTCEPC